MPFCTKTECSLPGSGSQRSVAIMTFQHISSGLASVGVPRNTLKVDSSVQSLSCVQLFATPSELAPTHVHRVSGTIQPSHPLSSPSPPAFNLSQHQSFSNELALHIRWPKYWSFSLSISLSNEYSKAAAAAASAKSLQLCLTLCSPIDGCPLGSSVPGILQARILEWVAISFSSA